MRKAYDYCASADEDGDGSFGNGAGSGCRQQLRDAGAAFTGGPAFGEVVKEGEGVSFAAAELGRKVEHGVGFGALAGEAADDLAGEGREISGQVGSGEEPVGLLVVRWGGAVAHVVEVDGEFGGVEGFGLTEVLAGRDYFVPGFQWHNLVKLLVSGGCGRS